MSEREGASGECGLFGVPDEIRDRLAETSDLNEVGHRWAETEELQANRWSEEDPVETLSALRDLAGRARGENRQLWIWWSL